jgi:hypothetical protein
VGTPAAPVTALLPTRAPSCTSPAAQRRGCSFARRNQTTLRQRQTAAELCDAHCVDPARPCSTSATPECRTPCSKQDQPWVDDSTPPGTARCREWGRGPGVTMSVLCMGADPRSARSSPRRSCSASVERTTSAVRRSGTRCCEPASRAGGRGDCQVPRRCSNGHWGPLRVFKFESSRNMFYYAVRVYDV